VDRPGSQACAIFAARPTCPLAHPPYLYKFSSISPGLVGFANGVPLRRAMLAHFSALSSSRASLRCIGLGFSGVRQREGPPSWTLLAAPPTRPHNHAERRSAARAVPATDHSCQAPAARSSWRSCLAPNPCQGGQGNRTAASSQRDGRALGGLCGQAAAAAPTQQQGEHHHQGGKGSAVCQGRGQGERRTCVALCALFCCCCGVA